MKKLIFGLSLLIGLQLQASSPNGFKCVAKPIDDITYSIIIEFKAVQSKIDGLFDLSHERAVYRNHKWSVERWTINAIYCAGSDTQMTCSLRDEDTLVLRSERGTYTENPLSGMSQYQQLSTQEVELANANISLTMKEFQIDGQPIANYSLRGQLTSKNNKSLSSIKQEFRDCDELNEIPLLEKIPIMPNVEAPIEIRPAIRVEKMIEIPYATPVAGKAGYVYSPYNKSRILDVIGIASGTKVKDPETQEVFLVP
ncbi:MAG: hypothetical protein R3A80_04860 [Bdellovibrionota bacterium]